MSIPAQSSYDVLAEATAKIADVLGDVLHEGDIDERSRLLLAGLYRALHTTSALAAKGGQTQPPTSEADIGSLSLSVRTYNALMRAKVTTIAQLFMLVADRDAGDRHALLRIPQIGPGAEADIEQALRDWKQEQING
jgi:hypothetical protein